MMRIGATRTLADGARRTAPLTEWPLQRIWAIPHTASVRARLAHVTVGPNGEGEVERQALRDVLADATTRDELVATRPDGCWCFGRGGDGERAVLVPGAEVPMVLSFYCDCADGDARRSVDADTREEGRAFAEKQHVQGIWEGARIPQRFDGCTLETFPITTHPMRTVVRRVRDWLDTTEWVLVLHGPYGVGKTGLGIGALRLAADRRQVGLFVKAPDLLTRLRATYGNNADATELDVLESLRTVPLLMLDDIGADRVTDWATALLFQVLDARHDNRQKTILTTNLDIAGLTLHLGERTIHRFEEGAVFLTVDGPNLRKDQKGA